VGITLGMTFVLDALKVSLMRLWGYTHDETDMSAPGNAHPPQLQGTVAENMGSVQV